MITNSDWHEAQLREQRLPYRKDLAIWDAQPMRWRDCSRAHTAPPIQRCRLGGARTTTPVSRLLASRTPVYPDSRRKKNTATVLKRYWIHGLWLVSVPLYLWGGARPDRYAIDVLREASAYPLRGVLGLIVITSVEAMTLYTIIRPRTYDRSWKRTGTALFFVCRGCWCASRH